MHLGHCADNPAAWVQAVDSVLYKDCAAAHMGKGIEEATEEGCSLIWAGAALSDSLQQWVLRLTIKWACWRTRI